MSQTPTDSSRRLGRGLAALIPSAPSTAPSATSPSARSVPIERLHPNKHQPRKHFDHDALSELAKSIEIRGVLQPIIVRQQGEGAYEIVAGERRWRAAAQAGLHDVPVIVKDLTDAGVLEVALIENIQRQDLDPLEEAQAYTRLLKDHSLTQEQVADAVGKSRAAVANALRLLKLPEGVLAMLADGRLTAGHARAVMTLDDAAQQENLAKEILARSFSVRDAERRARQIGKKKPKAAAAAKSANETAVEEKLQRALGTKVRLHHRKGKGRLEVFFYSLEQLDGIIDRVVR